MMMRLKSLLSTIMYKVLEPICMRQGSQGYGGIDSRHVEIECEIRERNVKGISYNLAYENLDVLSSACSYHRLLLISTGC